MYRVQKFDKTSLSTNVLVHFLQLLRVRQWSKNIFVLSGLLISLSSFDVSMLLKSIFAFLLFCGISSSVYIINDIADIKKDNIHPVKRFRPLPSGNIKVKHALVIVFILCSFTLSMSFMLNRYFGIIVSAYFVLNLLYSFKLKEYVFIDLLIISTGFVLRALSGIWVISTEVPYSFLLCIAFLTLFLGLNKRKKEIIALAGEAKNHRKNLSEYSIELINEIMPMLTACTIITYSFYAIYEASTKYMIATVPIVLYGILRYQYLVNKKNYGESPELVLLKDKPFAFIIILWGLIYISLKLLPML